MKIYVLVCCCVFVILTNSVVSQAVNVRSTFDSDIDGWGYEGSGNLYYISQGGHFSGYARYEDISGGGGDGWIIAPAKFHGDWTTLDGQGVLSWDHIILQAGGVGTILQAQAMIEGPGGTARCTTPEFMTEYWKEFSVPIDETAWWVISGTWADLISNVTVLKIRIEAVWNNASPLDIDGVDNVILTDERTLRTDLNRDGVVNFEDFAIMAAEWLETELWY